MEEEGAWKGVFERKDENLSMESEGAWKGAFERGLAEILPKRDILVF